MQTQWQGRAKRTKGSITAMASAALRAGLPFAFGSFLPSGASLRLEAPLPSGASLRASLRPEAPLRLERKRCQGDGGRPRATLGLRLRRHGLLRVHLRLHPRHSVLHAHHGEKTTGGLARLSCSTAVPLRAHERAASPADLQAAKFTHKPAARPFKMSGECADACSVRTHTAL